MEVREPIMMAVKQEEQVEKREETPEQITANQIQLIEQQMRQFVQIVTQNFLQTCQHPLYKDRASECKVILVSDFRK